MVDTQAEFLFCSLSPVHVELELQPEIRGIRLWPLSLVRAGSQLDHAPAADWFKVA